MSKVAIYLNFQGQAEEAFTFYKSVFGTEYSAPIMRIGDLPADPMDLLLPKQTRNV